MTASMVLVTAGMVHVTNLTPPGSECAPTRGVAARPGADARGAPRGH
jgi:hypothetical protein